MAQEQENIEVGDIVQLKSGGPAMTVNNRLNAAWNCKWFDGTELKSAPFSGQALTKTISEKTTFDIKIE